MLEISEKKVNGASVISVSGRVDSTNAAEFDSKITGFELVDPITLDIEKLEYISSAGLRAILKLRKSHADLTVKNASTEVYEVFDMTGFTEMMHVTRAYRTVSVEGCEVIGQGANGKVYRIDPDTVVKVYLNPDSLAEIEHERDVARKALVLGIPTAISYDVVKVGDHYASMFEMLNAKSLSKLLAAHPENIDEYVKMNVDLMRLIHGTLVPKGQLPDQRDVAIQWVEYLNGHLPEDVYEKLHNMVVEIPQDDHMIHGDYHTKNVMLQNDEVILIDMDTLAVGHPILELASMYNAYLGFSALNHANVKNFLGFDYEIGKAFWEKSLALYLGTDDEAVLKHKEKQAQIMGTIRLLRRSIKRKESPEFIAYCKDVLCKLTPEINSLID